MYSAANQSSCEPALRFASAACQWNLCGVRGAAKEASNGRRGGRPDLACSLPREARCPHGTGALVLGQGQTDLAAGAFLIGLRNAEIDDNAILIKCEVADLDPRQLRSSEGAPKAHQHKCLVAQSGPRPQARPTMLRMSLLSRGDFPI